MKSPRGGSDAEGISVTASDGRVLWSAGNVTIHDAASARVTWRPPAGEVRGAQGGGIGNSGSARSVAPTGSSVVSALQPRRSLSPICSATWGCWCSRVLLLFYAGYRLIDLRMFAPSERRGDHRAGGELETSGRRRGDQAGGRGPLTESLRSMVGSLTHLVSAIRISADDAAALGEEISAATEQMTSSTQEVAATTQELTDRATRQAATVRIVADDAARILAIAQELAAGALQATERNAALVRLAEKHRSGLRSSASELSRLAEDVEQGTVDAEALAKAADEIELFISRLPPSRSRPTFSRSRRDRGSARGCRGTRIHGGGGRSSTTRRSGRRCRGVHPADGA
jgi:hypothetical protein